MATITNLTIVPAHPSDLETITDLLTRVHLPSDGIGDHLHHVHLAMRDQTVIGCVGLEVYGTDALLRSVAVDSAYQRQGIGGKLVDTALKWAKMNGIHRFYLLTETAKDYFAARGFIPITRADVPITVKKSVEFTTACPESALVMMLALV